jgi:hypothetical protein
MGRTPPKAYQYQPGQSGNPSGRPKRSGERSFSDDLWDELQAQVTIVEGGKKKRVTKQQVLIKSMLKKATEGEPFALKVFFEVAKSLGGAEFFRPRTEFRMTSTGMALIDQMTRDIETWNEKRDSNRPSSERGPVEI